MRVPHLDGTSESVPEKHLAAESRSRGRSEG